MGATPRAEGRRDRRGWRRPGLFLFKCRVLPPERAPAPMNCALWLRCRVANLRRGRCARRGVAQSAEQRADRPEARRVSRLLFVWAWASARAAGARAWRGAANRRPARGWGAYRLLDSAGGVWGRAGGADRAPRGAPRLGEGTTSVSERGGEIAARVRRMQGAGAPKCGTHVRRGCFRPGAAHKEPVCRGVCPRVGYLVASVVGLVVVARVR